MALLRQAISQSRQSVRAACRPTVIRVGLLLAAVLAALTGFGFLLAAIYGALAQAWGAPMAGLILAAGLVLLAAALVLAARLVKTGRMSEAPIAVNLVAETAVPPARDLATMAVFTAAFVLARRFPRVR